MALPMSALEYDNLAELIGAHRERLHQLQLKQALLGAATPEHIPIEIDRITSTIERLSGQPVEMTTRERYLIDQQWQMRIEGDMFKLERKIDRTIALLESLLSAMAIRAVPPIRKPAPRRVEGGD